MKFATATALTALLGAASAAKDKRTFAVLHFTNKQLTIARADPIVNPGQTGTHVHHVLGGSNFGISSTGKDLMDSKCSTAKVKGDNSNYWFPSLYFKDPKTGTLESVELFYANVYYFFEPTNDKITAFPTGLQIFSGDPDARSPPATGGKTNLDPSKGPVNPVKWTCPRTDMNKPGWPANSKGLMAGIADPVNKGEGVGFPDVACDGYASPLRADVHLPSCYNPKAGLTDYKNNMAWPQDNHGKQDCPEGYIHVPHLFFEAYWNTPKFSDRWEQGKGSQPFVLSSGDVTGYSLHADFMAAWDEPLLQHIIDTCDAGTTGMENCAGLFYGKNEDECTIDSPIPEKVTGELPELPGKNALTGWAYGGSGNESTPADNQSSAVSPAPVSSSTKESDSAPATQETAGASSTASSSVSGSGPGPAESSAPAKSQSDTPSSAASGSAPLQTEDCKPRKTHTVYNTVTVTASAPVSAQETGSAAPSDVEGFKYAGCFKDAEGRTLNGKIRPNIGAMSNAKCIRECKKLGFSVAGTEYGGQCYCGNELVGSERLDDSACDVACEDEAATKCGGSWALSVYSEAGEVNMKDAQRRRHMHAHVRRQSNRY